MSQAARISSIKAAEVTVWICCLHPSTGFVARTVIILISSMVLANSAFLSANFLWVKLLYFSWDDDVSKGKGDFLLSINATGETKKMPVLISQSSFNALHLLSPVICGRGKYKEI